MKGGNNPRLLVQLDGNLSISSADLDNSLSSSVTDNDDTLPQIDKISSASYLPVIATYNARSLLPKINSFKTDIIERSVDVAFVQEIWEKDSEKFSSEIEKMLEMDGFRYISMPRPLSIKKRAYGGAAIVVNSRNFTCKELSVNVPSGLEAIWAMISLKKTLAGDMKNLIVCSFYSPPDKLKNSRMSDHIVTTLHSLYSKYPNSGIILGSDRNDMDISPILSCGLKLHQIVTQRTRGRKTLDILITNLGRYYKTPKICPPLEVDNPLTGKPSDHSVPVCYPHKDRYNPPERSYRIIKYRPLPESCLRKFGQWIVKEDWLSVNCTGTTSEQAVCLENLLIAKVNEFCPEKSMKLGFRDKPFITSELKSLNRRKCREYLKRGKSHKYLQLRKEFKIKYKSEAKKYLSKTLGELRGSKPGRVFNILKRLGSGPGESESHSFNLPEHDNLNYSDQQSVEAIADHFASISQDYQPLKVEKLPERVKSKLLSGDSPPVFSEYEVWCQIVSAKKPKSGVANDLPRQIVMEFSPELASPLQKLVNSIFQTGEWPENWKLEQITPIPKVPAPENENDLRPISLTPFFSKVTEQFVVKWLLKYIGDEIDFRQYGGLKGNSITHYIVEFINFILAAQESPEQTAILACLVDFSKAFNRQDHCILVTKLSDMGVPGWLLKIVISFLQERRMVVRYRGKVSSPRLLPGGGPQGTVLALLLFIVLVNDIGFESQVNNAGDLITSNKKLKTANEIHLKFVDDLTIGEKINLKEVLVETPLHQRTLPDVWHARTGHTLPPGLSRVQQKLDDIEHYASTNLMKINSSKTKAILFNPCKQLDFAPKLTLGGQELEVVEKVRLLGVTISADMKWHDNTKDIVARAYKKLWILRRLKSIGASPTDLVKVYSKQIRCIMELAAPAWQGSITENERIDLERVQKSACRIILGVNYLSYSRALDSLNLESLDYRRMKLSVKFALKAEKSDKFKSWFVPKHKTRNTRSQPSKYIEPFAKSERFWKSPLCFLTRVLNEYYRNN